MRPSKDMMCRHINMQPTPYNVTGFLKLLKDYVLQRQGAVHGLDAVSTTWSSSWIEIVCSRDRDFRAL